MALVTIGEAIFTRWGLPHALAEGASAPLEWRFSGRQTQVGDIVATLATARVVTLVGPCGVGKSRLAHEVAQRRARRGGVSVVSLQFDYANNVTSMMRQVERVVPPLWSMSHVDEGGGATGSLRGLLILDGCDFVREGGVECVGALLARWPGVALVVTASRALGAEGECVFPVGPLATTRVGGRSDTAWSEAGQVLAAMARSFATDVTVEGLDDAPGVSRISRFVGGVPLALRVVAPSLAQRGPVAVLNDLMAWYQHAEGVHVPRGRGLTVQDHIRLTVTWCLAQLCSHDRTVLEALAVFPGGCDVEPLVRVLRDRGAREADVIDALAHLCVQGLVNLRPSNGGARFFLCDAIRHCVRASTSDRDVARQFEQRKLEWCREFVAGAHDALITGTDMREWLERIQHEQRNLQSSLEFAQHEGDVVAGAHLACDLWRFWELTGQLHEGRSWLETFLSVDEVKGSLRVHLLDGVGMLAWRQDDSDAAQRALRHASALARADHDEVTEARLRNHLGLVALFSRQLGEARTLFEESMSSFEALGVSAEVPLVAANLALVEIEEGAFDEACRLLDLSAAFEYATGDRHGWAVSLLHRSIAMFYVGDSAAAVDHARAAAAAFLELGDERNLAFSVFVMAATQVTSQPALAVELASFASATLSRLGVAVPAGWSERIDLALAPAHAALGASAPESYRRGARRDPYSLVEEFATTRSDDETETDGWSVQMLGTFRVRRGGTPVDMAPQVACLVKLVALRDRPVHVEEIIEQLWPGTSPARGRRRLRNVQSRLHRSAGPVVERHHETLSLARDVRVDVREFHSAAERALVALREHKDPVGAVALARQALDLYTGELLPGDLYESYTLVRRDQVRRCWLRVLTEAATAARECGRVEEAETYLRTALDADDCDEARYLALAEFLLSTGRFAQAREVALRASRMCADLGVSPSRAILDVLERTRRRQATP